MNPKNACCETARRLCLCVEGKKMAKIVRVIRFSIQFDCFAFNRRLCRTENFRIHTKNHKTICIIPTSETTQFRKSVKSAQSVIISACSSIFFRTMVLYGRCISINDDSLTVFFVLNFFVGLQTILCEFSRRLTIYIFFDCVHSARKLNNG